MRLPVLICVSACIFGVVHAVLTNYTVDDADPSVVYDPLLSSHCTDQTFCDHGYDTADLRNMIDQTLSFSTGPIRIPFKGTVPKSTPNICV
jgi:hypothetical protein